jgi:hypothetical protein
MKKSIKISIPVPKIRKPVQKKPNTVMKSKKDYKRKGKHGKRDEET